MLGKGEIQRVLLIRRKALGDCLVTLPAVRALTEAFPEACFDLVIDRPFAPLISLLVPEVSVISWSQKRSGWSWYQDLRSSQYDLVIDWLGSPRTAMWTIASGAGLRVGYDLPRRRWAYNRVTPRNQVGPTGIKCFAGEAFMDPLRALGLEPPAWQPGLFGGRPLEFSEGDLRPRYCRWRDSRLPETQTKVALMMSATWPAKAWANEQIVILWRDLVRKGFFPMIIPGPGDDEMMAVLRQALPPEAFAPATNLLELADLLGTFQVFIGTDGGGRHLAAALGLPTVTVFGPTDVQGWNPSHPRHVSITRNLDCLGCDLKICPLPGHPCLDMLPADLVLAGMYGVLQEATGRNDDGPSI